MLMILYLKFVKYVVINKKKIKFMFVFRKKIMWDGFKYYLV